MDWFIKRITNPFFTTVSLQKNCTCQKKANTQNYRGNSHRKTTAHTHIDRARNPEKSAKQEATVDCGDIFNWQACKLYRIQLGKSEHYLESNRTSLDVPIPTWMLRPKSDLLKNTDLKGVFTLLVRFAWFLWSGPKNIQSWSA